MEAAPDDFQHNRPYRSKRHRPCDACRARKVCCRIDTAPPCYLCRKSGTTCTYLQLPTKKRKLVERPRDDGSNSGVISRDFSLAVQSISPPADEFSEVALENSDFLPGLSSFDDSFPLLDVGGATETNLPSLRGMFSFPTLSEAPRSRVTSPTTFDHLYDTPDSFVQFLLERDSQIKAVGDRITNHISPESTKAAIPEKANTERTSFDEARSPCNSTSSSSTTPVIPVIEASNADGNKICSINDTEGFSAQYFGLSGESDPFLLNHIKYDENHERRYFKVHFRKAAEALRPETTHLIEDDPGHSMHGQNATSSSNMQGTIPIQFMMTAKELTTEEENGTAFRPEVSRENLRQELDALVSPNDGKRLIELHYKFVFPYFPAVSRKVLQKALNSSLAYVPTHLLGAIYASSLPFVHHDPHLCVRNVYSKPSENKIWHIVLEDISRDIHSAHLSVLQAALLYLQKSRRGSNAAADTPFTWAFLSSVVGLATSLGLHLDCSGWAIPCWEKRLRRRLWWLVYSEEKWLCLLLGRPSLINRDQWDVTDLTDQDFITESEEGSYPTEGQQSSWSRFAVEQCTHFRYLVLLAQLAEEIYHAFYTLRAAKRLAHDFDSSLQTARPLREQLRQWYTSLPESLQIKRRSGDNISAAGNSTINANASLHFAYLTLEVLLYRAMLRPLGRKLGHSGSLVNASRSHNGPAIAQSDSSMTTAEVATRTAAATCARLVVSFTAALDSGDFGSFWYSWSHIGFSIVTSFVALLVVQAPDKDVKVDALALADSWHDTLRIQSKSFDQMRLGLLRLDVMYWIGFDELFSG